MVWRDSFMVCVVGSQANIYAGRAEEQEQKRGELKQHDTTTSLLRQLILSKSCRIIDDTLRPNHDDR